MLIDFGKANWLAKARQQPDKVRQVLEKARTDGLIPTLEAVQAKLAGRHGEGEGLSNLPRTPRCRQIFSASRLSISE